MARLDLREPYTPQVVDGRAQVGGLQTDKIETDLRRRSRRQTGPRHGLHRQAPGGRRFRDRAPRRGRGLAWRAMTLASRTSPSVDDNRGQTVPHRNVVVEIKRLGAWRGRPTAYRMPQPPAEGLASAVIVQGPRAAGVIAAAQRRALEPASRHDEARTVEGETVRARLGARPHAELWVSADEARDPGGLGGLFRIRGPARFRPTDSDFIGGASGGGWAGLRSFHGARLRLF